MPSTTLRVSVEIRDRVNRLGRQMHRSAGDVLQDALDHLEADVFWRQYGAAAAAARADADASRGEAAERELWDRATADGLEA